MFDFLYDYSFGILPFDDEVAIRYKDSYILLFEMHGQGCYRSISPLSEKPERYVEFSDIVRFYETGEKPYRSQVFDILNKAFDILEVASCSLESEYIDVDKAMEYILDNLK